ncbi:Disintegrin and metalloproteinase domain-containing protein 9 [Schistosoma japonicum]|nr:Disintegrin and metalloproteinase domain-containing protein 9 [Schistosoma japonicum]
MKKCLQKYYEGNSLFAPFNIVIVIVRLEIWEQDRVSLKVEEHHLLTALAQFKRMYADVRHDCLHALLGTKEQGSRTRGKANHMTMCIYSRCVGYSRVSPTFDIVETARTVAHELGHNFGLRHDTEECECQGCIMATGVEDLPGLLNHGMGVCLHDLPVSGSVTITSFISNSKIPASKTNHDNATIPSVVHIYDWQSETKRIPVSRLLTIRQRHSASSVEKDINGLCGNGILDPGEECDCVRCRLRGNSECAGGPCCDIIITTNLQQNVNQSTAYCKLKSSGTICRNESGTCDLPEYCDGHSQWCPPDVYKMDGELCYTEEGHRAHCVRGGCREADGWCRVLWGKTGKRADKQCFFENEVWNRKSSVDSVANCGIQRPLPRDRWEDSQTRVIHSSGRSCSALVYDPVWPASDPATWDENKSFQINANGAGVGLYSANTQDAGMVPDGTPCSRGFCYNGSCKSVDDVRPRYSCYCNRHGICNNLGHCHCLPGYKPPYCNEGGNGGSIDSGPPPKTNIKDNTLLIVICMLFFVILPLMGFGVYYVFIRSGRCLLSTSKEFIYTSSGLPKTSSKQSSDRLKKPYPLLAFTTDPQPTTNSKCISGQTNGYCNNEPNGKLPNGFYKSIKSNSKVNFEPTLSNKTTREYCTQNNLFVGSSTESRTATTATEANKYLLRDSRAAITSLISKNDKNEIRQQNSKVIAPISHLKYVKTDSENACSKQQQNPNLSNCTSVKSTTFISEPRLEAMTYEGPMCSLNDAVVMNTLQRKSKGTLSHNQSAGFTFTTDSQSPPPINKHNPIINQQPVTLGRQPLSSKDISKPLLQATTYNERLSDLESARIRLAQKEFEI